MKKRSEVVESSKLPGLAGRVRGLEGAGPVPKGRARARQHVEHPEGARHAFLLLSATVVACS